MKLQEIVFMSDLIKRNYRRRMFWFFMRIFVIILCFEPFLCSQFFWVKALEIAILVFVVLQSLNLYHDSNWPWTIKKNQAKALNQFSEAEFDELICSVPLKEYFNV